MAGPLNKWKRLWRIEMPSGIQVFDGDGTDPDGIKARNKAAAEEIVDDILNELEKPPLPPLPPPPPTFNMPQVPGPHYLNDIKEQCPVCGGSQEWRGGWWWTLWIYGKKAVGCINPKCEKFYEGK